MIQLIMSSADFEQDIKPLIKEFYPEESIQAYVDGRKPLEQADRIIDMELLPDRFKLCVKQDALQEQTAEEEADIKDRKAYRGQLARAVYRLLHKHTGKTLPWGTLVGVRPVKLIYEMLAATREDKDILAHMEGQYYCSEAKVHKGIRNMHHAAY